MELQGPKFAFVLSSENLITPRKPSLVETSSAFEIL